MLDKQDSNWMLPLKAYTTRALPPIGLYSVLDVVSRETINLFLS
jgi:hypothetical protein